METKPFCKSCRCWLPLGAPENLCLKCLLREMLEAALRQEQRLNQLIAPPPTSTCHK